MHELVSVSRKNVHTNALLGKVGICLHKIKYLNTGCMICPYNCQCLFTFRHVYFVSMHCQELQLKIWPSTHSRQESAGLFLSSVENSTDNIIQFSVYTLPFTYTSLAVRKYNQRKVMGVQDVFLSHIHSSPTYKPLMEL